MSRSDRHPLGDFLRARREQLTPEAAKIPATRRRRTPGLRREEVAERAGIGVDWYIRLEQGRSVTPSAATVDALARALRLTRAEHAHLRALVSGSDRPAFQREQVPDAVRRIVQQLGLPAYVTGRRWDVLAWNDQAADILTDFAAVPEAQRNILIFMLTQPAARKLFGRRWSNEAQRMVALFRATHDLWAGDPAFADLLQRLREGCAEFDGWWNTHAVGQIQAGHKQLRHPRKGTQCFEYASFQCNDDPALRLVIYTTA